MNNMDESDYENLGIEDGTFDRGNNSCDICGAPLDPEDKLIHLCKICQGIQFEDDQDQ